MPTLLTWLRQSAGWWLLAALVTVLAAREMRSRIPTVDAAPITVEEPVQALTAAGLYPTVRVRVNGKVWTVASIYETPRGPRVVLARDWEER